MNNEDLNIEIQEEKLKKGNKSKLVIFLLSVLVLGLLALCVYNNYQLKLERDKNNNTIEDNINTNTESNASEVQELNINSGLVQGLYNLVNIVPGRMDWKQNNGITAEEMAYIDKFNMAIKQITTESVNCNNYKDLIIKSYGSDAELTCGDGMYNNLYFDPATKEWSAEENQIPYTDLYKEKDIKNAMYQIFGKDYYERKDKIEDYAYDYVYIADEAGYIKVRPPKGGTGETLVETLKSAKIVNDELQIIVDGKLSEKKVTLTYIFKYNSSDRSYYFDKLEIK